MKIKRFILLVLILLLCTAASVFSEQLTTVAVLDVSRVYSSFLRESQAVRNLEQAVEDARNEIQRHEAELLTLRERRIEAMNNENNQLSLQLDSQIQQKQQFIDELRRVRSSQLERQERDLMASDAFLQEIQQAVRFVSESQGYTIVLNASDPYLQWWASEVDITDSVIQRLRQTRR